MPKRMFRVEFEAEDVNGILLPINADTVTLYVQPSDEGHWSEVEGVISMKLNVEAAPDHPANNQFSVNLVNMKDYVKVNSYDVVTEKIIRKN